MLIQLGSPRWPTAGLNSSAPVRLRRLLQQAYNYQSDHFFRVRSTNGQGRPWKATKFVYIGVYINAYPVNFYSYKSID